jgi:hypothetical protein
MKKITSLLVMLLMLTGPTLFAIDNLKLNSQLEYSSDSIDGPLITGEDAQSGFVAGKTNYVIIAYSGEVDQGSGVMPISVPVDSDQVIGAERRWQSDCVGSDRNRQEEVGSEMSFGAKRR